MTRWHCPVCGLDFGFHSELDWHIRDAHCLKRTAGLAGQLEREAVLSSVRLRRLQAADTGPSVSLLLWTTPAAVMTASDKVQLHHLVGLARDRLAHELKGMALTHVEERLKEAVRAAEASPTDHGLALFVGSSETAIVPLPFAPRERAVVNHAFVTRDVLDALQRFPMYRALVLRGPGLRLLEGRAERLSEVMDWQAPNPSVRRAGQSAWTTGQRRRAAFAAADQAIGERVAIVGRLPLVLIGRGRLLADFRKHSPHAGSVVGEVTAWGSMLSTATVAKLAAPVIGAWRDKHSAQYLKALADAESAGKVTWGLANVWDAIRAGRVERLWVERDYWCPGVLLEGGTRLMPADGADGPVGAGRVEDAVDLAIERAALSGAHVEMVERLSEQEGHRIAAQIAQPVSSGRGSVAVAPAA